MKVEIEDDYFVGVCAFVVIAIAIIALAAGVVLTSVAGRLQESAPVEETVEASDG